MTDPHEKEPAGSWSWVVFVAALLAGFVAAGTVATSPAMGIILVLSLSIATFLGILAHSILTGQPGEPKEAIETDTVDPVGIESA